MHARHILLCSTKVTFLCGKSPNDSGKSHLEIAAFFHFHCNCFITFYICFFTSFTTGTVTLGIQSMQLQHYLDGYSPHLQHRFFKGKNFLSTASTCTLICIITFVILLSCMWHLSFNIRVYSLDLLWHVDYECDLMLFIVICYVVAFNHLLLLSLGYCITNKIHTHSN